MPFWLYLGLLEWYDYSWVSVLGFFPIGLLEWYDYSWVSCLVLSCLVFLALRFYLSGTITAGSLVLFCRVFLALRWFT